MSDAGEAFGMFLKEYKKRLPDTQENEEFIEMIEYMIGYFRTNHIIYQGRWDDWISPNDPKYWRNPTQKETDQINALKKLKQEKKKGFWDHMMGKE
jgi:hypothetical protein